MNISDTVAEHSKLVATIARVIWTTLPSYTVELDDLIQMGMMGLLSAAKRYKPSLGAAFPTYASKRIRGAILDGLRAQDWMPREERRRVTRARAQVNRLESEHGRMSAAEISAKLEMSIHAYHVLQDAYAQSMVSDGCLGPLDQLKYDTHGSADPDPLRGLAERELRSDLYAAIAALPEKHQRILGLYYEQGLTLREVGAIFGITESRVCQIHTAIVKKLRAQLR